jgi:CelD/BcsL family acetyltransferase involved in cellulose biosynthesis
VFLRWEWIHTWWDIFRKNRTLFILAIRRDGRLVGIAPFFIEPASFLGPRRLRFCSDELSPDYMDLILEKGQEQSLTKEIVRYILSSTVEWDIIYLDQLRAGSPLLDSDLYEGLAQDRHVSFQCPYITIQGVFEDYFRSRSGLVTYDLDKKQERLFNQPGVRHLIVKGPEDLDTSLVDFFALRKIRSADKGMTSSFAEADVKRFHHEIGRLFLQEGILNLQMIYDGAKPISAAYAFNYGRKVYFFQMAFDPLYKKYSAGALMFRIVLQAAFTEGFREFDTLKGNEPYKWLWANDSRDEMNLTVYNRNSRAELRRRLRRLKNVLRGVKKKIL